MGTNQNNIGNNRKQKQINLLNFTTMTNTTTQTTEQLIDSICDLIQEMDSSELIQLNNEYCQAVNACDSEVWSNDEDFLNTFFYNNADALARAIFYGDYRYCDDYVRFNGYGNLETFSTFEVSDLYDFVRTMAEYIAENPAEFTQFDDIDFNNIED